MYETRGQDNVASTSIGTYDVVETFKLNVVDENEIRVV